MKTIPHRVLAGTDRSASLLALGTSYFGQLRQTAPLLDGYAAMSGNLFDTAWEYGQEIDPGCCERALGRWMRTRGVRDSVVLLVKGGRQPYCNPDRLEDQLSESMSRLNVDYIDIYMMHRDDATIPAAEFVDVLASFVTRRLVRSYGFSNWTPKRVDEAAAYAQAKGLPDARTISNQLSLAVMERPLYTGCISSSDPASREWLRARGLTLIPWSSQGRGVFTAIRRPEDLQHSRLGACWYSPHNVERLRRAQTLGQRRAVLPVNIALAWVLHQPFKTHPIIGPRNVAELGSSVDALNVQLSNAELSWLNLEQ
jgi:aryl-alcohol dehydrogenase-like predicted oxidoreductase